MTENPKPIETLSKTVVSLLKIEIALLIIAVFAGAFEYYDYSTVDDSIDVTQDMLLSDWITMAVGLLQTILSITLGVAFLMWIYRINKNLNILSEESLKFTPGWSVGWYFIPIGCLYKPYQSMKEIYLICRGESKANMNLLGTWWFFWILSAFAARIALRMVMGSDGLDSHLASTVAYMVSDFIDLLLAFYAFRLVSEIWESYRCNFVEQVSPYNSGQSLRD